MSKPLPTEDLAHILTHARDAFASFESARIFITGGTGFFGHWLLESLLYANREMHLDVRATVLTRSAAAFRNKAPHIAADPAITLLQADIKDFGFPAEPHTHIVHAATDTVATVATQRPPDVLAESILEGTRHVLQFAQHSGARRLLYTSSGAVYGRGVTEVGRISEAYTGGPDPRDPYGVAKRASEDLCVAETQGTPLECSIARCFAFAGPHLPLDQHFAIGNFIRDAMAGTPIHIKGDGTPLRSFLYMSDLAISLWTMLATAPANRAYNIGSDEAVSIAELARATATALHPGLPIQIDGTAVPGAPTATYVPDISRAEAELGLRVAVPLADAIRKTAAWHGFISGG